MSRSMLNQYLGFHNTPQLWDSNAIYGLEQIAFKTIRCESPELISPSIRLGKRVEQFVFHELKQQHSITILAENIQVIKDKVTIGELDCILSQNDEQIHLEIVYKFYLYDATVGTTELERWIGPNRRDSLVKKLVKLKEKQLPILCRSETEKYLTELNLKAQDLQQKVYFKAQLFVPIELANTSFKLINNECVKGFYIRKDKLNSLHLNRFYIPTKMDWLSEVQKDADWQSCTSFVKSISLLLQKEQSPLCWTIDPKGKMSKFFVVWWD